MPIREQEVYTQAGDVETLSQGRNTQKKGFYILPMRGHVERNIRSFLQFSDAWFNLRGKRSFHLNTRYVR